MRLTRNCFLCLLLFTALPVGAQPGKTAKIDPVAEFDAYVQQAVRDWQVPGLAIVVIKDGQTILKKGYGVRQLGRPEPVDTPDAVCLRVDDQGHDGRLPGNAGR